MAVFRIRQPPGGEIIGLADWLEAILVIGPSRKVSRSRLQRYLRGVAALDGDELDVQTELLLQELIRRRSVIGHMYPFEEDGTGMRFSDNANCLSYLFLLCISASEPLRSENRQADVEVLLDMLVKDALCHYLGGESRGVHFGWPTSGARPPSFPAAIGWLAQRLGLSVGKGEKRSRRRDGGVDIVVWRPFRDAREGFVTILAQCTAALDWTPKAKDIVVDLWRGYIDFGKDPITCLAIPFVIPCPFAKWDELRRTVHFVLDRLRLCELLEGSELSRQEEMQAWTAGEFRAMGAHEKSS